MRRPHFAILAVMPQSPPSFVVILTDDQGYGDLSCMGATDFQTPHLDALAAAGARCACWYSNSPVCSPSRASLLTGRYPANAGVRSILGGHRTASGLHPSVPTLATVLRQHGYRTAMFGKWHLGVDPPCRPDAHGFEQWFGFLAGCIDYYSHIFYWSSKHNPLHDLWDNGREVYDNGAYFTDLITRRAVDFLADVDDGEPFFLYVAYNAPHYPMHAPARYVDRFPHLPSDRRIMAAMLAAVDDGVGAIMDELRRRGRLENTCIIFTSDNGPSRETRNWLDGRSDPYYGGSSGGFRGGKFSLFEGGIRVPGIVTWPNRISAGQVITEPVLAMDIFPTVLAAAGGDANRYSLDGRDVLPVLMDGAACPHERIFWEMGPQTAVREGRWKLVLNGRPEEGAPPVAPLFLADLEADPGEQTNLADQQPRLTTRLKAAADKWRADIETRWTDHWQPLFQLLNNRTTTHTP
jgi:arylsulfatase A-like enzyme